MGTMGEEIKKLYSLSAGRCNLCGTNLFENQVHIGEMAHIIAKSTQGPRGADHLTVGRNSYENLILLCANHHLEVDRNTQKYTVEYLHQIKREYENYVESRLKSDQKRQNDVTFLSNYLRKSSIIRIPYWIRNNPNSFDLDIFDVGDMFEWAKDDMPHLFPLNDPDLQCKLMEFMDSYYRLENLINGVFHMRRGRYFPHFLHNGLSNSIHMDKNNLPHDYICKLNESLHVASELLRKKMQELITFIRRNYDEINIDSP